MSFAVMSISQDEDCLIDEIRCLGIRETELECEDLRKQLRLEKMASLVAYDSYLNKFVNQYSDDEVSYFLDSKFKPTHYFSVDNQVIKRERLARYISEQYGLGANIENFNPPLVQDYGNLFIVELVN